MSGYLPRIEWEGLQAPWVVEDLSGSAVLPPGAERVELRRDEQYRIEAKIVGTRDGFAGDLLPDQGEPGEIIPDYKVEGSGSYGNFQYDLDYCVVNQVSVNLAGELEANLQTHRVQRTATSRRGEQVWLTEWYLNAHDRALLYPRLVKRRRKETYHKEREYPEEEVTFEGGWSEALGHYAFVETPDLAFAIEPVSKDLGPGWSKSLAIEYRDEWSGVPEEEVRRSVANAVSFVMGRHLVGIGHTAFDDSGLPIKEIALNPQQKDLVHKCGQGEHPPVKLDQDRPTDVFEKLLARLVPRYLDLNEAFGLDNILAGYWLFEDLPLGDNLPTLAMSLEMLKKAWYSSSGSKSRGIYMSKKKFDELLGDELNAIEQKLEKVEHGDRMASRMRAAFNFGSNESIEFFLEELSVPIDSIERSALRARNSMAHGSSALLDEARYQEMVDDTLAYRTLFNRVLLKLLDYEGTYIDYSARGWPERSTEQPLLGKD